MEPPRSVEDLPGSNPLRRVFKRTFGSHLVRASIEDLSGSHDRSGKAAATWRTQDRAGFISAMRALSRKALIKDLWIERFARALIEAELPAEALAVLVKHEPENPTPKRTLMASLALLRLGATADAVRSLEACADTSDDEARQLIGTIQRVDGMRSRAGQVGSWSEIQALVEQLLEARLPELAAAAMSAFLEMPRDPTQDEIASIAEYCFAIFRTAKPQAALELLGAMGPVFRAAGAYSAYVETLAELENRDGSENIPPIFTAVSEDLSVCLGAALAANGHWRAAASRFVLKPGTAGLLSQVMCELARAVGQEVISSVAPRIRKSSLRPKVIDVFPFNGEVEMLELKLDAMGAWTDRFVVVEARKTFTGQPKALTFPSIAERLGRRLDKIVYRPVEEFPAYLTSAWAREFYQRDQALHALADICTADDVVIISDVDEMLDEAAVRAFEGTVAGADLRTSSYFLNFERLRHGPNVKAALARWRVVARTGCSWLRIGVRMHLGSSVIPRAGWHFTNIGTAERLAYKFSSFSHEELSHQDKPFFEALMRQVRAGGLEGHQRLDIGELPEFVRRRRNAVAHLLLDDGSP